MYASARAHFSPFFRFSFFFCCFPPPASFLPFTSRRGAEAFSNPPRAGSIGLDFPFERRESPPLHSQQPRFHFARWLACRLVKLTSNGTVRLSLIQNRFGLVVLSLAEDRARLFVPSSSIKLRDINLYPNDSREGSRDRSIYLDEGSASGTRRGRRARSRGSKSVSF